MGTLVNSEDPVYMLQNIAFHPTLHCFVLDCDRCAFVCVGFVLDMCFVMQYFVSFLVLQSLL